MTEQEEAVGRQRLEVLTALEKRLIALETDRDVLYPEGDKRHPLAAEEYDKIADIVGRLETDPSIGAIHLLDTERKVTGANEQKAEAEKALAAHTTEAAKQLATHQTAVDKATTEVTEAQSALDALKI